MDNIGIDYDLLKSALPDNVRDFIEEVIDKEKFATILLYLSTAVRERITLQECILRYEPRKIDEYEPRIASDPHGMIADRIYYETKLRLVRRAPIDIESDVVKHTLDSVAQSFIEELRQKLKL